MKYPDIYFEPSYAKLYVNEHEKAVEFRYESVYGLITNLFILREVPWEIDGIKYYDITTPYGYGGPVIQNYTDKEKLIEGYISEFKKYTQKNKIISEFIRFHPILQNGLDFKEIYESIYDRKTVGTNLKFEDVIGAEFSKHKRKDIKRILKKPEIKYEVIETPTSLDEFLEIYYNTMYRDQADQYYFFDKSYFDKLLDSFRENIITCKVFYDNIIIGMGIYFKYGKFLHAHLSGSLTDYLNYSPAYILKYAMALYGHEKGYEIIHYGGGSSADPENSLYKFKKDFGKNTQFDFYIAKKIWNKSVYNELCKKLNIDKNSNFFPAYRTNR